MFDNTDNKDKKSFFDKENFTPDKISGGISAGMDAVGALVKVKDNIDGASKLDERGNRMGKVDVLGNTLATTAAGAQVGGVWGAAAGLVTGLGASLLAKTPTLDDMLAKETAFQLDKSTQTIMAEDNFAKSQLMAKDGIQVSGEPKVIETEKNEIVLRKYGKIFKKVGDFKESKSHKLGGQNYKAQTGDIIFPSKDRAKIDRLLKHRRWGAIESAAMKLPVDEGQTSFAKGTRGVNLHLKNKEPSMNKDAIAEFLFKALTKKGLTETAAKGMIVNLAYETADFTTLEEMQKNVYGTKGLGLAQWTDTKDAKRRTAFEKFLKSKNTDVTDMQANVDFLISELKGEQGYSTGLTLEGLNSAKTLKSAANMVLTKFERPQDQSTEHLMKRIKNAEKHLKTVDSVIEQEDPYNPHEARANRVAKLAEVKAKEGYIPYEDYVEEEKMKGEKPESEDWYEQNVVAKAQEQKDGFTTMNSYSGRKRVQETGIARKGYDYIPQADPTNPKNKLKGFNDVRDSIIAKWKKENPNEDPESEFGEFATKDFDAEKNSGESFETSILADLGTATVNAVIKPFYQSTEEAREDDFHNIFDEKLRNQIIKAHDFIGHKKGNGNMVTRGFVRGMNKIDGGISQIFDGSPYQGAKEILSILPGAGILTEKKIGSKYYEDPGNNVGTNIHNLIVGESLEDQEQILKDTIKELKLDDKAQNYLWTLWSDPESFKNQQMEATEDLNVVLAAAEAPKLLASAGKWVMSGGMPKAIKNSKQFLKHVAQGRMLPNGNLTAKGIRALRSSPEFKKAMMAAKNAPEGTSVIKKFRDNLNGIFKSAKETKEGVALNTELAKLTQNIDESSNIFKDASTGFKDAVTFYKKTWKAIKNVPDNLTKKLSGMTHAEATKAVQQLEELTGLSPKEFRNMSPDKLKSIMDKKTVQAFDAHKEAVKDAKKAWTRHDKLSAELKKAKEKLKAFPQDKFDAKKTRIGEIVDEYALDVADSTDEYNAAKEAVKQLTKSLEESRTTLQKTNAEKLTRWNRISQIEKYVGENPDNFRIAVKGEQALASHLDELGAIEGAAKELKNSQKKWLNVKIGKKEDVQRLRTEVESELGQLFKNAELEREYSEVRHAFESLQNSKTTLTEAEQIAAVAKKTGLDEARVATLNKSRAKASAIKASEDAAESSLLLKEINKYDDVRKAYNRAGRVTTEVLNSLRKKGPLGKELEEEAKLVIDKDPKPRPKAKRVSEDPTVKDVVTGDDVAPLSKDIIKNPNIFTPEEPSTMDKVLGALGDLTAYAPAVYNIGKGMQPAAKTERNYINPALETYQNNSQTQLNTIDEMFNTAVGNARNTSGGLMSNFRANIEKSWVDKINATSKVNAQETQNAVGVANRNIDRTNQASQYNAQVDAQADQMDARAEANKSAFLAQGIKDIANIGAVKRKDKNLNNNQDFVKSLMGI